MAYCSLGDAFPGIPRSQRIDPNPPGWAQGNDNLSGLHVQGNPDLASPAEQHAESERCRYLEYLYLKHLQEKYPEPTQQTQNVEGFSLASFKVNIPDGLWNLLSLIFLGVISLALLDFSLKTIRPSVV